MPGEPFGMAMSEDGESITITHQNETKTSLFSTGLTRGQLETDSVPSPSLQFVLDGVPFGGIGLAPVPHDRSAFRPTETFPHPAFLQTSRAVNEVDLLRQYPDELAGAGVGVRPSLVRPFLDREAAFPITIGAGGTDSRGIVIDPTPRIACKAKVAPLDPTKGRTQDVIDAELRACAQKPARVFIANRSPASLSASTSSDAAAATTAPASITARWIAVGTVSFEDCAALT